MSLAVRDGHMFEDSSVRGGRASGPATPVRGVDVAAWPVGCVVWTQR